MGFTGLILTMILAVAAAVEPEATSIAAAASSEEEKYQDGVEFNNNLVSDLSP